MLADILSRSGKTGPVIDLTDSPTGETFNLGLTAPLAKEAALIRRDASKNMSGEPTIDGQYRFVTKWLPVLCHDVKNADQVESLFYSVGVEGFAVIIGAIYECVGLRTPKDAEEVSEGEVEADVAEDFPSTVP